MLGPLAAARAATFTNDTVIGYNNSSYDGQNIIITNSTVTVDGPHGFLSLHILNGGVLTHSASPNAILFSNLTLVSAEAHTLSVTNPAVLSQSNVVANSVVVADATGTNFYILGTDYSLVTTGPYTEVYLSTGSSIPDGGTILVTYDFATVIFSGLYLSISNNAEIEAGGVINATGTGYGPASGPGAGQSHFTNSPYLFYAGSGGGHGGYGGASSTKAAGGNCYGSIPSPMNSGSGGGTGSGLGGSGGGVATLAVGGTLRVDGQIAANGADGVNPHSGGGAGGSLWLAANSISGAGAISANGGVGEINDGGGGGGGQIAIAAQTNSFTGTVSAQGGLGAVPGGAGTIYTADGPTTQLLVDNGGRNGTNTLLSTGGGLDLTIRGGAVVQPLARVFVNNLTIGSNSWFTWAPPMTSSSNSPLSVAGNAIIEPTGGIIADGKGYAGGSGRGAGQTGYTNAPNGYSSSGGGYGGAGGNAASGVSGGITYGSLAQPTDAGSGGGGNTNGPILGVGAGGGAVQLTVVGSLTLNGRISADGADGAGLGAGAGSGGSVFLTAATLSGAGTISANGGRGATPSGGGGGGGRVAIYFATNSFAGNVAAHGGLGYTNGGAGTIYLEGSNLPVPQVIIDNGGFEGASNTLISMSRIYDLTLSGGAAASQPGLLPLQSGALLRNLFIGSNSWFLPGGSQAQSAYALTVTNNLTIQPGGGISFDGTGYTSNPAGGAGPGAGRSVASPYGAIGGGGGHSGLGGASLTNGTGGLSYDIATSPTQAGSGGGNGSGEVPYNLGGSGGGSLNLIVSNQLILDGLITANGLKGIGQNSGGGAGGSISLTVGTISGSGLISANGGAGDLPYSGGGGGGRIALRYFANAFAGSIFARGGAGANLGGAGTIYYRSLQLNSPRTSMTVDNGGLVGTNTPISPTEGADLTVSGAARALLSQSFSASVGSLFIASNSFLICSNTGLITFQVNSNATIQSGGAIVLDANGYAGGAGQGAGHSISTTLFEGGGGGFGGNGGPGANGAASGPSYGYFDQPNLLGSGGGNTYAPGGSGGGALKLVVLRTLTVDGTISAHGGAAIGPAAGGGSGGALWLTAGTIAGSGIVSANGGSGDLPYGGGGGGGRIFIFYGTGFGPAPFTFTGQISAHGGPGATYGGAGTVYLLPNSQELTSPGQLILDNGGVSGYSNTALAAVSSYGSFAKDFSVTGGASALMGAGLSFGNLLIGSNGWVTFPSHFTASLSVNSLTIFAGGGMTLDGLGNNTGPGNGRTVQSVAGAVSTGGSYAGYGGASFYGGLAETAYGSLAQPTDLGSGGGNSLGASATFGSIGGGALRLTVGNLTVNGRLSADGLPGLAPGSGGGSGGSLWLTAGTITGSGIISANGGNGDLPYGGGGGGGRISLNCISNGFTGALRAIGGAGAAYGGAGTIFLAVTNTHPPPAPQVIVDNGGQRGTNTPLTFSPALFDLSITGGAAVIPTNPALYVATVGNLNIGSNSWLAYSNSSIGVLLVRSSATIQSGGGISLKSAGFGPGLGTGAGGYKSGPYYNIFGAGGGYGGLGGSGITNGGGTSYGSILRPTDWGSGGGSLGQGAGAGALQIVVAGDLNLNGTILANGDDSTQGGGGSGGSLWVTAGRLLGSGLISANGGNGDAYQSGGGGGGRIALYFASNLFQGTIRAWGGLGAFPGGAGTIYSKANSSAVGQLLIDSGGRTATNTPISTPEAFTLNLAGSAVANLVAASNSSPPFVLGNLMISSGAALAQLLSNLDVIVLTNASILAGASIRADGSGYSGETGGPGAGAGYETNIYSSGAGYGGPGGASSSGISGGSAYGSFQQPADRGSRGGLFPLLSGFSQGGGAIRLRVGGQLLLDGRISANGIDGLIEGAGGGSGGSVWLTARSFGGSGMVVANGGAGASNTGGGGGGGRIALYSLSNSFSGALGAYGGPGASWGCNGTIYVVTNIPAPQILAQSPTGVVESAVSSVSLTFNSLMNFSSASSADFSLDTPNGPISPASFSLTPLDLSRIQIAFPPQSALGYYQLQAGPQIEDIYGQNMSAAYVGSFAIVPPVISGRVVDTNGLGVPYLTLQVSSDPFPTLTDANGYYSIEVPPSWSGTITPIRGGRIFILSSHSYTVVSSDQTNQNFVMATAAALTLRSQKQGTNLNLGWYGINGVSYQVLYSADLKTWLPYSTLIGTNGPAGLNIPIGPSPNSFFRFSASY